ncbi:MULTISPECIES: LPS export ABC transporter periplasmic protein LptC [unclassified Luteibacter]|uniref:LPS export ABC transporter periplasmic protein LptC n=1 Tax=unclassified Luteibacter TaxID=2620188 RepID=UPI0008D242AD|nr:MULTISPECIES: LPS export ABC transporter periplasmic protein LptC [unclassified Luteibacter]MDR6938375.1 lipopolysaccharide export system protein LptC [Luteibacter sp. 3190]SEP12648.1 lipopolysaccharide export system protein LptC [Luteibacter sp. UNC138MFCol5.1]SEW04504.1 lipopolysaccharide export system protein LptC [Luteibacter sp. 329MFSha]
MSVLNFFRDRSATGVAGMLAVALGASVLLYYATAPEKKVQDFVGPPRSGYVLTNFNLDSFNEEGKAAFTLTAPHLERREGDESLYINAPDFVLPSTNETNAPPWTGHSQYGWVNKDGSMLKLQGKVHMDRVAFGTTPPASIDTSEVSAWPKENRLETAEAARIVQGTSTMDGVGMRANLDSKHLELLDAVHSTYQPRKR